MDYHPKMGFNPKVDFSSKLERFPKTSARKHIHNPLRAALQHPADYLDQYQSNIPREYERDPYDRLVARSHHYGMYPPQGYGNPYNNYPMPPHDYWAMQSYPQYTTPQGPFGSTMPPHDYFPSPSQDYYPPPSLDYNPTRRPDYTPPRHLDYSPAPPHDYSPAPLHDYSPGPPRDYYPTPPEDYSPSPLSSHYSKYDSIIADAGLSATEDEIVPSSKAERKKLRSSPRKSLRRNV